MSRARSGLAVAWSLFQLYTAYAGMFDLLIQLPAHVAFATALGFLTPPVDAPPGRWRRRLDALGALLALACGAHYIAHNARLVSRMALVDDPWTIDVVVGVLFALLLLEASRRHIGSALVALALAFVVYAFVGPGLPSFLSHGGVGALKLIDQQMLTTGGVFGLPTLVSATYIYLFVLFGAVMANGGLLRFFTDLGLAVAGSTRGGAGEGAGISSGPFRTRNGTAIAHAPAAGRPTIPPLLPAGPRPALAARGEAA